MLLLKKEEEKYSLLIAQDEGLDKRIAEEELNFKEVMRFLKFFYGCHLIFHDQYLKNRVK
jgi:hypothetical protein